MIYFPTGNPDALLLNIKSKIDEGKIKSWSYDKDGDFTLSIDIWNQQAWLHPIIAHNSLNFSIIRPRGVDISKAVYAVYHGRFIEVVLRFFDEFLAGNASASAFPVAPDDVG